jgi:hypothetical protein
MYPVGLEPFVICPCNLLISAFSSEFTLLPGSIVRAKVIPVTPGIPERYTEDDSLDVVFQGGDCCGVYTGGQTGNTNCDTEGKRNLADVTQLITRVYLTPEIPLCCEPNGNTNGIDPINLADITKLIDYVYISHTETAPCQ